MDLHRGRLGWVALAFVVFGLDACGDSESSGGNSGGSSGGEVAGDLFGGSPQSGGSGGRDAPGGVAGRGEPALGGSAGRGEPALGGSAGSTGGGELPGSGGESGEPQMPETTGGAGGQIGGAGNGDGGASGDGGTAGAGGAGGNPPNVTPLPLIDETAMPEPALDVGFIELEAADYSTPLERVLHPHLPELRHSEPARMFYRFVPADNDAKHKPVFVFFNGGPGFTSMLLMSFGTGPMTLDADEPTEPPKANASSLTQLGNLLYIDARDTGFSYLIGADPEDADERGRALSAESFNPGVDAADFVRVVLRVMERQPALRNNPVVLVGESYGGLRAPLMLDYLLYPARLTAGPDLYGDAKLRSEILAHYAAIFGKAQEPPENAATYAQQFGWQILIQPFIVGQYQRSAQSALTAASDQRMAAAAGISLNELTSTRCLDNRARSREWCTSVEEQLARVVASPAGFSQLMGVAPQQVSRLRAAERSGAFRALDVIELEPEANDWLSLLGPVAEFDRYYANFTPSSVGNGFDSVFSSPLYGLPFVRAARYAQTMVTNARWDANVLSDAIVPALNDFSRLFTEPRPFTGARYVGDATGEAFTLSYSDSPGQWTAAEREIYYPTFENSGHMLTVSEPVQFLAETRLFLEQSGL